jgi:hypothetical protein
MSFDLSRAMDAVTQETAIMSDDLYHGGSYASEGLFNRGIIRSEDVNGMWGSMHRARWVAESGIVRMKEVLGTAFDASALAARANIYAGISNRLLGENTATPSSTAAPETTRPTASRGPVQRAIRIAGPHQRHP